MRKDEEEQITISEIREEFHYVKTELSDSEITELYNYVKTFKLEI